VVGIVITGANGKFSGGFDISQFQRKEGGADISKLVNEGFLKLVETGPKPTVAALSTLALGGGCELAVACNGRVATTGAPKILQLVSHPYRLPEQMPFFLSTATSQFRAVNHSTKPCLHTFVPHYRSMSNASSHHSPT
jgi:hypothetical protein